MPRRQVRHATLDGAGVRARRLELKLSQEDLAREVLVTLRTIQRWEDGANQPQGAQLLRLAKALDVDPAALYLEQLPAA